MEFEKKKKIFICIAIIVIVALIYIVYTNFYKSTFEEIDLNDAILDEGSNIEENLDNSIVKEKENGDVIDNEDVEKDEIIIHIIGEVKKEGIVSLKEGDRVIDAIKKAGGETKNADLSQVNLAYILSDGQKIYIPSKNEKIDTFVISSNESDIGESGENNNGGSSDIKININTATESQLDTLPGVGPSTAMKIIEYRNTNGKFKKIEDIKEVKGIGDAKYEELKNYITI